MSTSIVLDSKVSVFHSIPLPKFHPFDHLFKDTSGDVIFEDELENFKALHKNVEVSNCVSTCSDSEYSHGEDGIEILSLDSKSSLFEDKIDYYSDDGICFEDCTESFTKNCESTTFEYIQGAGDDEESWSMV